MDKQTAPPPLFESIFDVVRSVPKGRVVTYGQIADFVGRCSPLMVGFAMAAVPFDSDVPWHRVVNRHGRISSRGDGDGEQIQKALLEAEGVCFDEKGRIDLEPFQWKFPVR